jgi:hypothetical protein
MLAVRSNNPKVANTHKHSKPDCDKAVFAHATKTVKEVMSKFANICTAKKLPTVVDGTRWPKQKSDKKTKISRMLVGWFEA